MHAENRPKAYADEEKFWQQQNFGASGADESDEPFLGLPVVGMTDSAVEKLEPNYCDRSPTDFVISGPLATNTGPGRRFATRKEAEKWARAKYGARFRREIKGPNRWAFLVAVPKEADV